ncbi:riboflavin biosynthesis protein RibF [Parabacteroides provencensis]|uniref:riboflavin biosynthesis protein RibF n=1 Tax=Parabacteroides provencensis TaxID=1944636 RepID=UPI000C14C974|nr:riboflavin biosynthesis protein RibF [Parabacteroides provencensis]
MVVVKDFEILKGQALVATIGFFDGVHRGHRFLIEEMKQVARLKGLPSAVITFADHPRAVLHSDYQPKLLNSFEEKLEQLETTGVDYCIVLDFTVELSRLSASEFIHKVLARRLHVNTLLIGYDHRFGHDRTDGFGQYVIYGKECGIEVIQATVYDAGRTAVSSSEIRHLIEQGNVEDAAYLLTYPYQIKGHIVSGYKVGRTLGFPTANIESDEPFKVLPGIGVYAVYVYLKGFRYEGMLYIGSRPTLNNGTNITLEVNIFDFSGDIYNDEIIVSFIRFVRGDEKFESLEALKEQLEVDRVTVKQLLMDENE